MEGITVDLRCVTLAVLLLFGINTPVVAQEHLYEVSGGGSIRLNYAGVERRSTFSYRETITKEDLEYGDYGVGFGEVTFTVNGVTSSGWGDGELYDNGELNSGYVVGAFEWSFRSDDGNFSFFDDDLWCIADGDWGPECDEAYKGISIYSNVEEIPGFEVVLSKSEVTGCRIARGTLKLREPAPVWGADFTLDTTDPLVQVPESLSVPPGATQVTFTVKTSPVPAARSVYIRAYFETSESEAILKLRPIGVASTSLAPTTVVGGLESQATVKLECDAAPGPVTVDVVSSAPGIASPVTGSIVIPQGLKSEKVRIATAPSGSKQTAKITASANGTAKTRTLSVISAAAVSATSLGFGNQLINTTSAPLSVVLSNKGAAPFTVDSLTMTGTQPKMFVPSHDCPAILAAGASCAIEVRFTPASTGKKAAQLNISTSAKDVPLVVKMSGTGI
jgi:hypothetical protein